MNLSMNKIIHQVNPILNRVSSLLTIITIYSSPISKRGLVEFILFANNCINPHMHVASNIDPDHVLYLRKHVQMCCIRVKRRKSQRKLNTMTNNHQRILHIYAFFDSHDCTSHPPVALPLHLMIFVLLIYMLFTVFWRFLYESTQEI